MSASETDLVTDLAAYRSYLAELLPSHPPPPLKLFFDLEPENADSLSAALVDLDDHAVQLRILACSLIPDRQASQESRDHQLRLDADHAVIGTCHSKVSYVARATRQNLIVGSLNMCVCTDDY